MEHFLYLIDQLLDFQDNVLYSISDAVCNKFRRYNFEIFGYDDSMNRLLQLPSKFGLFWPIPNGHPKAYPALLTKPHISNETETNIFLTSSLPPFFDLSPWEMFARSPVSHIRSHCTIELPIMGKSSSMNCFSFPDKSVTYYTK